MHDRICIPVVADHLVAISDHEKRIKILLYADDALLTRSLGLNVLPVDFIQVDRMVYSYKHFVRAVSIESDACCLCRV